MTDKTEILYGYHPVREALRAGRRAFFELYLADPGPAKRYRPMEETARRRQIPVNRMESPRLASLAGSPHHQGIGARVSTFPFTEAAAVVDRARPPSERCLILLLDAIVDPQNLGAILRTVVGMGAEAVVIPKDRSAGPTPAVSKASAGVLEHVRLCRVTNMAVAVDRLKRSGMWVYGLDATAGRPIFSADLTGAVALVVGGEEKGIRPLVKAKCDLLLSIPQHGRIDSLNASVAAAVAMYEVLRQQSAAQATAATDKITDRG
jgi:23S rRNA (guanosine2251-2'-O)-methyltransferase